MAMITESQLVERHILHNQSTVVEELLNSGVIPDESLYGEWWEVMEWRLVTPYLARLLADENEIIIEDCGCFWWGRQSAGQAIYMDAVMTNICQSFD